MKTFTELTKYWCMHRFEKSNFSFVRANFYRKNINYVLCIMHSTAGGGEFFQELGPLFSIITDPCDLQLLHCSLGYLYHLWYHLLFHISITEHVLRGTGLE